MTQKIIKYYLPVLIWAFVIFLFSANPQVKASEIFWQDFILKKAAHIGEYAILSFFVYRVVLNEGFKKPDAGLYTVLICIIYAFSDEYHQLFVKGRTGLVRDIVFDTVGASFGVYFILNLLPKLPPKIQKLVKI